MTAVDDTSLMNVKIKEAKTDVKEKNDLKDLVDEVKQNLKTNIIVESVKNWE